MYTYIECRMIEGDFFEHLHLIRRKLILYEISETTRVENLLFEYNSLNGENKKDYKNN